MKTVITSTEFSESPLAKLVINHIQELANIRQYSDEDAVVYFGFPKFYGYEDVSP